MNYLKPIVGAVILSISLSSSVLAGNIGLPRTNAASGNIGLPKANATGNIGLPRASATGNIGLPRFLNTPRSSSEVLLDYENIGILIRFFLQMGSVF